MLTIHMLGKAAVTKDGTDKVTFQTRKADAIFYYLIITATPVERVELAELFWPEMTQAADEYRRVTVTGHYLDHPDTLVLAVTAAGRGSWVMSAFQTAEGWPVLINRGFVPEERRQDYPAPPRGLQQLSGLLRLSQPDGAFLRSNDPAQDRWFSRDTKAIGLARGITGSAPWFLDLDTAPEALPMPGLTVVSFRNPHLGYALTWFAMAATTVALLIIGLRSGRDKNQRSS